MILQCKQGSHQAQMTLYNQYYSMVFNSAYRIVQNKHDAEDLMQEAFLTCLTQLDGLHDASRFGGWIKKTVINKSINFITRKKEKWLLIPHEDITDNEEMEENDLAKIKAKLILEEINNLPDGYRIILNLYLLEGYDHQEIGEILQIKSSTSRSQYTRAKKKLQEILQQKHGKQFEK